MKIADKDLISDETRRAARNLLLVTTPALFVYMLSIDIDQLEIMSVPIPGNRLAIVAMVITIYDMYILLINWIADFTSWRTWTHESEYSNYIGGSQTLADFVREQIEGVATNCERANAELQELSSLVAATAASLKSMPSNLRTEELCQRYEKSHELLTKMIAKNLANLDNLREHVRSTDGGLTRMARGIQHINWTSGIILFVNNLLVPVGMGMAALYFIVKSLRDASDIVYVGMSCL
ncbi:MAG: hypothetical protein AB7I59_02835 [Geminicoccaceae bacterium]